MVKNNHIAAKKVAITYTATSILSCEIKTNEAGEEEVHYIVTKEMNE